MSMLTVVQSFCERQNLTVPSTVYGSTDKQVTQIKALLEEEGNDLAVRGGWQALTLEASHTSVAAESQGTITSIADDGYRYIVNETIWDRSTRLPIMGPLSGPEWQALKALVNTGPRYQFRIRGGLLIVNPTPVAGESWYFEYVTENWITDATGTTGKTRFTADTDLIRLPESLVLMGLRWRWLREKGMDYAELFRTYELQVKDALGRDGGKPRLSMDADPHRGPQPGVWVSPGSWSV